MDRAGTLAIKRAGILLVAAAAGCGGSLSGQGGADASGGAGGGTAAACCPDGGQIVASVVHGRGFAAYEGRPVAAVLLYSTFATPNGIAKQATWVSGGAFDLELPAGDGSCTDSASTSGAGAIYIDADGDGVCNPTIDYLYTWPALGAVGTCGTIELSPQTPNCGGGSEYPIFILFEAAQVVCPATGGCLTCPQPSADGGLVTTCLI